ncbi:MAG: hypothetical protein U0894_13910 [Pirellulales bacterium]
MRTGHAEYRSEPTFTADRPRAMASPAKDLFPAEAKIIKRDQPEKTTSSG